jgi:hypothetical protein
MTGILSRKGSEHCFAIPEGVFEAFRSRCGLIAVNQASVLAQTCKLPHVCATRREEPKRVNKSEIGSDLKGKH